VALTLMSDYTYSAFDLQMFIHGSMIYSVVQPLNYRIHILSQIPPHLKCIATPPCNCRIMQFLHKMFNLSALLLDDALLKRVVTEVVLFSIIAFKTLTFYKVV